MAGADPGLPHVLVYTPDVYITYSIRVHTHMLTHSLTHSHSPHTHTHTLTHTHVPRCRHTYTFTCHLTVHAIRFL